MQKERRQEAEERENAARNYQSRHLDSQDPCTGTSEGGDGLEAAKRGRKNRRVYGHQSSRRDAFERGAGKGYGSRGAKGKGVSVFAIGSVEQGSMIMCEEELRQTPKDAFLEAVARGFMR